MVSTPNNTTPITTATTAAAIAEKQPTRIIHIDTRIQEEVIPNDMEVDQGGIDDERTDEENDRSPIPGTLSKYANI